LSRRRRLGSRRACRKSATPDIGSLRRSFTRRSGSICGSRSALVTSRICSPSAELQFRTRRSDAGWFISDRSLRWNCTSAVPTHAVWHLDEVYLKIDGRMVYLWRAVDAEGEVLDVLVQSKRNKHAALKLMRKLLRKYAVVPERMVTDDLRSYGAATLDLGIDHLYDRGRWKNNRAENRISRPDGGSARCNASRARAQPRSSSQPTPPSTTLFNVQRHLTLAQTHRVLRAAAMTTRREAVAAA
jgi:transposase-like protein